MDENWWASLLADEERFIRSREYKAASSTAPHRKDVGNLAGSKQPNIDWRQVQRYFERDEIIRLEVTGYNRGGLLVGGENMRGFVPFSHLVDVYGDLAEGDRDEILSDYVGSPVYLKIIECDSERGRIVFSERAALADCGKRNELLEKLKTGECVRGVITNITDFGIFVDLGGIEGLVHVSEISWGRVRHPADVVKVGQPITVHVIQVDKERCRIALSLKRLCKNPWESAGVRYYPGQVVEAVITSMAPFGAFARLEDGLDGLIHITEMAYSDESVDAAIDDLYEGQNITVRVLNIDAAHQRLGLSLKISPFDD